MNSSSKRQVLLRVKAHLYNPHHQPLKWHFRQHRISSSLHYLDILTCLSSTKNLKILRNFASKILPKLFRCKAICHLPAVATSAVAVPGTADLATTSLRSDIGRSPGVVQGDRISVLASVERRREGLDESPVFCRKA